MIYFPEGSGLMERTAPTALQSSQSELVEPGRSAVEVVDHYREIHECRCLGTLLDLLPAGVAVGLAFLFLVTFLHCFSCRLRLVGRLGACLPPVVLVSGGSRYDGACWTGGRDGSRVGHDILSHSGNFHRSARVQALTLRVGAVTGQPSLSSLARGGEFGL